jgi:multidrug resistance efflux pump
VTSLEKEMADLKAKNKELSRKVDSLEALVARNKAFVEDAEACMSRNVDLLVELKKMEEDLKMSEESHKRGEIAWKEAEELAEKNAKRLEDSRGILLACMQEAKVAVDAVFAKGGAEHSEVLPDADPTAFSAWLQVKVDHFAHLLDNISDFGAYGAILSVV